MSENKPKRPAFENEYKAQQKLEQNTMTGIQNKQEEKTKKGEKKMSPVKLLAIVLSVCAGIGISGVIAFNQYQKSEAAKAASEAQVVTTMADMSGDTSHATESSTEIEVGDDEVTVLDNGEIGVEDNVTKVLNEQGTDDNKSEKNTTKTEAEIKEIQGSEQPDFVIEPYDDTTMYCSSTGGVNVRALPTANSDKLGFLNQNEKVTMNGLVTSYQGQECLWYQIKYGDNADSVAYVNASYLGERPVETTASTGTSTGTQQSTSSASSQSTAYAPAQPSVPAQPAAPASDEGYISPETAAFAAGFYDDPWGTGDMNTGYADFN